MLESSVKDTEIRPLGQGWSRIHRFLEDAAAEPVPGGVRFPTLRQALDAISGSADLGDAFAELSATPDCLIAGISHPRNGVALAEFLAGLQRASTSMHAIDLCDVRAVFEGMGVTMPRVRFRVADAADLSPFPSDSVDLVVQDGLLNCTPHEKHRAILSEAARVLRGRGRLLFNFTDSTFIRPEDVLPLEAFEARVGARVPVEAFGLADMVRQENVPEALSEIVNLPVYTGYGETYFVATRPWGHFEFFFSYEHVESLLRSAGFKPLLGVWADEQDPNGFRCRRHRMVLEAP